jgi:HAD superfamily hydrolase (TIGR01490 family)
VGEDWRRGTSEIPCSLVEDFLSNKLEDIMAAGLIGAFFDFDKTLIDVESPKLGIRYMWERGQISLLFILKIMVANILFKRNLISDESMARVLISYYRNKKLEQFEAEAHDYYRNIIKPHLAPNIAKKVRDHKEQGHILILISAGIRYLLKPVVDDLGFDHLICTDLEIGRDGSLTGNPDGPICADNYKRVYASILASDLDLDLDLSYAYSDHHADIPLLDLVGYPNVVEPTDQLRKVAIERGWPILSFK